MWNIIFVTVFCIIGVLSNTKAVKEDIPGDPLINMFKKQELLLNTMEQTMQMMKNEQEASKRNIKALGSNLNAMDGKLNAVDGKLNDHVDDVKNQTIKTEANAQNVITELEKKKCRVGFSGNKFGCYKIELTQRSWSSALQACNKVDGSHLVRISSTQEVEALKQLMNAEKVPTENYWVDAVPKVNTNDFVWNDTNVIVATGVAGGAIDSTMLTQQHKLDLGKWLPNKEFKLLYKATRDGMSGSAFHSRCNNKGPTLSIGLDATTGSVFGGYTSLSWTSHGRSVSGGNAFIFRLCGNECSSKKHPLEDNRLTIYDSPFSGPTFGGAELSFFYTNTFTFDSAKGYFASNGYCNPEHSYSGGGLGCGRIVKWRDVEVYSVQDPNCLSLNPGDQQWIPKTCTDKARYICEV